MQVCNQCKHKMNDNNQYCAHCGAKLSLNEQSQLKKPKLSIILFCIGIVGILIAVVIASNSINAAGVMLYAIGAGPIILSIFAASFGIAIDAIVEYIKDKKNNKIIEPNRKKLVTINIIQIVLIVFALLLYFGGIVISELQNLTG